MRFTRISLDLVSGPCLLAGYLNGEEPVLYSEDTLFDQRKLALLAASGVRSVLLAEDGPTYLASLAGEVRQAVMDLAGQASGGRRVDYGTVKPWAGRLAGLVREQPALAMGLARLAGEDQDAYRHCLCTAVFAGILACHLEMEPQRVENVVGGALVHDLGKVRLPKEILRKNGPLTPAEMRVVQRHPGAGYAMLQDGASVDLPSEVLAAVIGHHERHDGAGYPFGIPSESLCLEARLVGVADVYDALTEDRVYRKGMPSAKALSLIQSWSGAHFAPALVLVLIAALGVHPPGMRVRLDDGRMATVMQGGKDPQVLLDNGKSLAASECGGIRATGRPADPQSLLRMVCEKSCGGFGGAEAN